MKQMNQCRLTENIDLDRMEGKYGRTYEHKEQKELQSTYPMRYRGGNNKLIDKQITITNIFKRTNL